MDPDEEGTMAAFATIEPLREFSVDTRGWYCPAGQKVRYPSGAAGTTVEFRKNACGGCCGGGGVGRNQKSVEKFLVKPKKKVGGGGGIFPPPVGIGKFRLVLASIAGAPNVPVALRVSATRQGATG